MAPLPLDVKFFVLIFIVKIFYANIWTHLKIYTWNVTPPFEISKYATNNGKGIGYTVHAIALLDMSPGA